MMVSHLMLAAGWILYCVLHSLLASVTMKQYLQRTMRSDFRYYRFVYTVFAFLSLSVVLFYQFRIHSTLLFTATPWIRIIGAMVMACGAAIMLNMIWKYFMQLSGVRWLYKEEVGKRLEVTGLHKYVRHPLYLGTFAFIWGWFFVRPYISYLLACAIITVYTLIGLIFEEQKLITEFGDDYIQYKQQVPKLFPRFRKHSGITLPRTDV